MANIDSTYRDYLRHIVANGRVKTDRTGTGTLSIFGYQMRWDLGRGFPLETTKFTAFRLIKEELLWFIRGSTNAQELIDRNCHIWDAWMVPEDIIESRPLYPVTRAALYAEKTGQPLADVTTMLNGVDQAHRRDPSQPDGATYLTQRGIPETEERVTVRRGELGPVYGAQWRSWPNHRGGTIDQLQECIDLLKTKPNSRRIIVSAWNPADLPDESKPPHVNAAEGRMALAACHTMFQFMTEPLSLTERSMIWYRRDEELMSNLKQLPSTTPEEYIAFCVNDQDADGREKMAAQLDVAGVPRFRLSCQLYQRSADSILGVPFNIASYALLTHMVAQCVNMVPGDFVHTIGDGHIYLNHFETGSALLAELAPDYTGPTTPVGEGVDTLIKRKPLPLPRLWLNSDIRNIDDFQSDHIWIEDYFHQGRMSFPVAV